MQLPRPDRELVMLGARVVETALVVIGEEHDHSPNEVARPGQPFEVERRFVERHQPISELGIVLQEGRDARRSAAKAAVQHTIDIDIPAQK